MPGLHRAAFRGINPQACESCWWQSLQGRWDTRVIRLASKQRSLRWPHSQRLYGILCLMFEAMNRWWRHAGTVTQLVRPRTAQIWQIYTKIWNCINNNIWYLIPHCGIRISTVISASIQSSNEDSVLIYFPICGEGFHKNNNLCLRYIRPQIKSLIIKSQH